MDQEFKKRLRQLGVSKGARSLKKKRVLKNPAFSENSASLDDALFQMVHFEEEQPLEILLPGGQIADNELGTYFLVDGVYPLNHLHGDRRIGHFLQSHQASIADFLRDERLGGMEAKDFLFLDTETTGLSGAGVFAFMIGLAFFEGEALIVRQLFARDQGEEAAVLLALSNQINELEGLITFNGRSFDLPLLEGRYFINRLDYLIDDLRGRPHIDLLHPSRRLWRRRLGSCSLGSLEKNLLAINRTHSDVPGWLIPSIYLDYVRSGDAREVVRVFYHNHIDMLSMVTLTQHVNELISGQGADDHPMDLHSLARWQAALGHPEAAESTLNTAMKKQGDLTDHNEFNIEMQHELAKLLKKLDRRQEAVGLWQKIFDDYDSGPTAKLVVNAAVELAMYYEWHEPDLNNAARWTKEAKAITNRETVDPGAQLEALDHRLARLERKLASASDQ